MKKSKEKTNKRKIRHYRIRKKLHGIADKPRLCVVRSLNHIYTQLIDDDKGVTVLALSTLNSDFKKDIKYGGNIAAAKIIGKKVAEEALKKGIKSIIFDRAGFSYNGRVKALADAAREAGLKF